MCDANNFAKLFDDMWSVLFHKRKVSAKCRVWIFECSCRAIMRMRSKAATAGQCLRGRTSVFLLKGSWPFDICVSSYLNDFHVHAGITCIALHRASFPLAVYLAPLGAHKSHLTPMLHLTVLWCFCMHFLNTPKCTSATSVAQRLTQFWFMLLSVMRMTPCPRPYLHHSCHLIEVVNGMMYGLLYPLIFIA